MNPSRRLVYEEEGLRFYLIDVMGEISFHIENELPINPARIKHLRDRLTCLLYVLSLKGMDHLDTWIPPEMDKEIRFAESFGFVPTGFDKVISYENGIVQHLTELRITF